MIKLQEMTPEVYYRKSRDFQLIGRLYDLVLNYVKTNAELINTIPISQSDNDQRMIDLMTMTLGFKTRHHYNLKQLTALCSAFAEIIKIKGTRRAIELACEVLLRSEGLTKPEYINVDEEKCVVEISIPKELSDLNLLTDLLDYILPAGMSCQIIRTTTESIPATTEVHFTPNIIYDNSADNARKMSIVGTEATTIGPYNFIGNIGNKASYIMNTHVIPATGEDSEPEQNQEEQ